MPRCYLCSECDALFAVPNGDAERATPVCPVCLDRRTDEVRLEGQRARTAGFRRAGRAGLQGVTAGAT
jgi:hypothetical protein